MNILFIVTDIDSANGLCVKKIAEASLRRKYGVSILTKGIKSITHNPQPNKINIYYSEIGLIERIKGFIKNSNFKLLKKMEKVISFLHRLHVLFLYPVWPISEISLKGKLLKKAREIVEAEKIDVIIPVYNAIEAVLVGYEIKQESNDILYIPYFLDSLYAGHTPRFMREEGKKKKALRWEKKLLECANGIVAMKPAKDSYEKIRENLSYFDKIKFLDLPLLVPEDRCQCDERKHFDKNEIVFLYAGSLPRNIRSPEMIIRYFEEIDDSNWNLYFVGNSDYDSVIKAAAEKCSRIHHINKVSHDVVKEMMLEANFLINIGNTLQYMVPSKIFEYMSLGKPIISMSKIKNDPSLSYLSMYNSSLIVSEEANIEENLKKISVFVRNQLNGAQSNKAVFSDLIQKGGVFYNNTPEAFLEYVSGLEEGNLEYNR